MGPVAFAAVFAVVIGASTGALDNLGREFIVGFMENDRGHSDVELFISTSRTTPVSVRVTAPNFRDRKGKVIVDESFNVTAETIKVIEMDSDIAAEKVELNSKGILIEASDEVSVFGTNSEKYSTDGFMAIPTDALGTEYYVAAYTPSNEENQFLIVATEDDTEVKMLLPDDGYIEVKYEKEEYSKNDVLNVKLNRLDTFQVQTRKGDLTGTHIKSSKKIGVYSGNVRAYVLPKKTWDHLAEQLPPVHAWGKKFAIVPTPMRTNTGDTLRFISAKAGTEVKVECSGGFSAKFTIDSRKYEQVDTPSDECCQVVSSEGIMVVLFVKSETNSREPTDPSMILIPPIEQYAAHYIFTTPENPHKKRDYQSYFTFVVKESVKDGLLLDGAPFPDTTKYTNIPNTDLVGGFVPITEGFHRVRHESPNQPFCGMLYGASKKESYGMPLGSRFAYINEPCVPTNMQIADGVDNDCDGLIDEELCTPDNGERDDDGDGVAEEDCAGPPPVDGDWEAWGAWTTCTVPAGGGKYATQSRYRTCNNPAPENDGKQCIGVGEETLRCNTISSSMISKTGGPDNQGREFIIGFMENVRSKTDVELFITTSKTRPVNVHVTAPKYLDKKGKVVVDETFVVTEGIVHTVELDADIAAEKVEMASKGILIEADDEISVYGTNLEKYSNDAFLGLPTDVLGMEYFAVMYYPSKDENQFLIVATEDDTRVDILFPDDKDVEVDYLKHEYEGNDELQVTMDRLDTFQVQTKKGDLTGTLITANKKIAVFSGNVRGYVLPKKTWDHLAEQLLPVETWGKKFAVVPTPMRTNTGDTLRFLAAKDGTEVKVQCSTGFSEKFIIDRRKYKQIDTPSEGCCHVEATEGIMIALFVKSQTTNREPTDPSMILIPPIEQYAAGYTFSTPENSHKRRDYQSYFTFVVKEAETGGLKLDGVPFPANTRYTRIPNTELVGGFVPISEGTHTVRHDSPIVTFGGMLYGATTRESYGLPLGLRLAEINMPCIPTPMVVGDGKDNDCDGLIDEELCTPDNGGKDDDGDGNTDEDCAMPSPIDGDWAAWSDWSGCSVSCGDSVQYGVQIRNRTCSDPEPAYDGKQCTGDEQETQNCIVSMPCPVDGNWAQWEAWDSCSTTCDIGSRLRVRYCTDPAPQNGGADCDGYDAERDDCDTNIPCPIDGRYSDWSAWSTCSATCGGGTSSRSRTCTDPSPQYDGSDCQGLSEETMSCNTDECPVDGGFTAWTSWGTCTATCGGGITSRTRTCTDPTPQYGGADCIGLREESQICNVQSCPIDGGFTSWSQWSTCTVTCGGGTVSRTRTCTDPVPQNGGSDCDGARTEDTSCNTDDCPIDGGFSVWTAWSQCPVTCGTGTVYRSRSCDNPVPQFGGASCNGDYDQSQSCDAGSCPVDGGFTAWSAWTSCPVTCGTGTVRRSRSCDNPAPANGGADCTGAYDETQSCDEGSCPVDGGFAAWSAWTSCPVTCGAGTVSRSRSCDNPAPAYGGADCTGDYNETQSCDGGNCPVDGGFSAWTAWTSCTVTCGTGTSFRERSCDNPVPQHGGASCTGDFDESQSCDAGNCPVDGGFSAWSAWTSCPVTCGAGTVNRSRSCDNPAPAYGGAECTGDYNETQSCDGGNCPVDGGFSAWTAWPPCPVTCGTGTVYRERSCDNPVPQHGGANCSGDFDESQSCDAGNCPIDGGFSAWSAWTSCPVTCGTGTVSRSRSCDNPVPAYSGAECTGDYNETQSCDGGNCPVDGGFSAWTAWTSCTVTCGTGTSYRERSCDNPVPQHGGASCSGDFDESQSCDAGNCPVDGGFSAWTQWTACPVTCGTGTIYRSRSCDDPEPQYGGADCSGAFNESQTCNGGVCPVNGGFSDWSSWSTCSATCSGGSSTRTRSCTNPAPENGGLDCAGDHIEDLICNTDNCPVDGGFSDWTTWTPCPVTCGTGTVYRSRSCDNPSPQYGGANCNGDFDESESCDEGNCPVDGDYTDWSQWTSCSAVCGGGTSTRSRTCTDPSPQYGGVNCTGPSEEEIACNTQACTVPVDGGYGAWSAWSACPVTCGTSTQTRTRECDSPVPQNGGLPCSGDTSESQQCDSGPCPVDGGFSDWSSWGQCTVTCGSGTSTRSRDCTNPAPLNGGSDCAGPRTEQMYCNTENCPVDGFWNAWSHWSTCSVTCGAGTKTRNRSCVPPMYAGNPCSGSSTETTDCTVTCGGIIHGNWGTWESWNTCTKTCGGGRYARLRKCNNPAPSGGGSQCSGNVFEVGNCNTQSCPENKDGSYVNVCPLGFFTCRSGSMTCIHESFKCDCSNDCDDGSDEDQTWAQCPAQPCESGANGLMVNGWSMLISVTVGLLAVLSTLSR